MASPSQVTVRAPTQLSEALPPETEFACFEHPIDAWEAARQSGRSDVPRIDAPRTIADLTQLLGEDRERRGVLLDPAEHDVRLAQVARGSPKLLLVVGPEGGLTAAERAGAIAFGFVPASLGRLVLRTETAGLVALAVVQHVAGVLG